MHHQEEQDAGAIFGHSNLTPLGKFDMLTYMRSFIEILISSFLAGITGPGGPNAHT